MPILHMVLYSTDATEPRAFNRHVTVDKDSAAAKVDAYANNMMVGGDVQAYSWHELEIDDEGHITSVTLKQAKSKPFVKLTRYNQKKAG